LSEPVYKVYTLRTVTPQEIYYFVGEKNHYAFKATTSTPTGNKTLLLAVQRKEPFCETVQFLPEHQVRYAQPVQEQTFRLGNTVVAFQRYFLCFQMATVVFTKLDHFHSLLLNGIFWVEMRRQVEYPPFCGEHNATTQVVMIKE